MGQGLHTKMIQLLLNSHQKAYLLSKGASILMQVASRALRIPVDRIHISETSTATVPNGVATAARVSSDLNGMAVIVSHPPIFMGS